MNTHRIDPADSADSAAGDPGPSAEELLVDLDGLHHLAVRAEDLARLMGHHGAARLLDDRQLSALEQARDNASAIIASLDRAR